MKSSKICIAGAPIVTSIEGSVIALIAYLFYFASQWIAVASTPVVAKVTAALPAMPTIHVSAATDSVLLELAKGVGLTCAGIVGLCLFVLWSKYNYERCQSFWTKQVAEAKPLPLIGIVVAKKPSKLFCISGSPLVTICELAALGGAFYIIYLFYQSIPPPQPEVQPLFHSAAEYQAYLDKAQQDAVFQKHVANIIGTTMLGLISTAIFVIWSKWNYTLCQRYWAKR